MNAKKDILPDMVRVMVQVMEVTTRLEDSAVLVLMDMVQQEVRGELPMSEEDAHLNAAANYIRSGHYKEVLTYLTESVSIVQDGISTAHRRIPD